MSFRAPGAASVAGGVSILVYLAGVNSALAISVASPLVFTAAEPLAQEWMDQVVAVLRNLPLPAGPELVDWVTQPIAIVAAGVVVSALALVLFFKRRSLVQQAEQSVPAAPVDDAVDGDLSFIYSQYGTSQTLRQNSIAAARQGAVRSGDTVSLAHKTDANGILAWLEVEGDTQARFPISAGRVKIGRHSENDIVLNNPTVHRRHAVLQMENGSSFELQDLGGANGTCVNGERCATRMLQHGDMLELGEVRLKFIRVPHTPT